jgi:hypothetical protein
MVVMIKLGLTNIWSTYLYNFLPGNFYTLCTGLSEIFKVLCKKLDYVTRLDGTQWSLGCKSKIKAISCCWLAVHFTIEFLKNQGKL